MFYSRVRSAITMRGRPLRSRRTRGGAERPRLLNQLDHAGLLSRADLEGQKPLRPHPRRDAGNQWPDHIQPVLPGKQRARGLPLTDFGLQIRPLPLFHIGRVRNDDGESLLPFQSVEQLARTKVDLIGDVVPSCVFFGDLERFRRGRRSL